ncbi:signal peptidase I [Herbiconiux sp. 11R-BC]|uniref:signal peptidase I n=1 Tax=Herbiconiux sp. 11R-BC TaxID=3111637 RepID=UPI003BFCD14A
MTDVIHTATDTPADAGAGDEQTTPGRPIAPAVPPVPARQRRFSPRDAVVTVVGVVGILAVVWLLASWLFSLSVIVFVTGSMAPSMPTGSAAVTQTVSAAQLRVGDVVTVPKPVSRIPVTHRIVAIDAVAGSPDERALTLKGDDNPAPDRERYLVSEAGRVIVSAPVAGSVIAWFKTPVAMVSITIAVAAVAAWGLWPGGRGRSARTPKRH